MRHYVEEQPAGLGEEWLQSADLIGAMSRFEEKVLVLEDSVRVVLGGEPPCASAAGRAYELGSTEGGDGPQDDVQKWQKLFDSV